MTSTHRLTRFEIMRRNRARRRPVQAQIDAVEEEIAREWAALQREQRAGYEDTEAWLEETKQHMTDYRKPAPTLPGLYAAELVLRIAAFFRRGGRALTATKKESKTWNCRL